MGYPRGYACTRTHLHTFTLMLARTNAYTNARTHACVCVQARTHVCAHMHAHSDNDDGIKQVRADGAPPRCKEGADAQEWFKAGAGVLKGEDPLYIRSRLFLSYARAHAHTHANTNAHTISLTSHSSPHLSNSPPPPLPLFPIHAHSAMTAVLSAGASAMNALNERLDGGDGRRKLLESHLPSLSRCLLLQVRWGAGS